MENIFMNTVSKLIYLKNDIVTNYVLVIPQNEYAWYPYYYTSRGRVLITRIHDHTSEWGITCLSPTKLVRLY